MNQLQQELQTKIMDMMNGVEHPMRSLQGQSYRCSADCVENRSLRDASLETCVNGCTTHLKQAESFIQNQMREFEERVQRCAMGCVDDAKLKWGDKQPTDQTAMERELMPCWRKCADDNLRVVPGLQKKILDNINGLLK